MRMSVEDEVGPILGDRDREAVGAEEGVDSFGLALERVRGRRVVEEDDPQIALGDLPQPVGERVDLGRRLSVDLAQERLAEVG